MARPIGLALALAAALASAHCAGGGPSGTHLSMVKGNVADTDAGTQGGVEGIRVSVEGTPFDTLTDATGSFLIEGDFAGAITLLFERADGLAARIGIEVPEGGTVTLLNVTCPEPLGLCEAEDVDVDKLSDDAAGESAADDEGDDGDEGNDGNDGVGNDVDLQPPATPPVNGGSGGGSSNPGNQGGGNPGSEIPDNPGGGMPDNPGGGIPDNPGGGSPGSSGAGKPDNPGGGRPTDRAGGNGNQNGSAG